MMRCPQVKRLMTSYPVKITFGDMREMGVRDVLIYCRDHRCSGRGEMNADLWPDHVRLSDCTKCGAEIRPKFGEAKMGTG